MTGATTPSGRLRARNHDSIALRDMIKFICARTGLTREDACTLCSLAGDLRVTQVVNGSKGIHIMVEKANLRSAARS